MQRSQNEHASLQYTTLTSCPAPTVGAGVVAFTQRDAHLSLQVCVTNLSGIELYSLKIAPLEESLTMCFSKTNDISHPTTSTTALGDAPSLTEPRTRFITQPLLDGNSGTVSWVETLRDLSPEQFPARLMVATLSTLAADHPSLRVVPCFRPSERDAAPALYALSVRDHDPGLGLLAIGNMIGELALYSFTGAMYGGQDHRHSRPGIRSRLDR